MLKIKLARFGKRNQPHYRFVVTEARSKRDGQYNASLGHYAPTQHPKLLEIDVVEYEKWVSKGAQPTDTVASLFKRYQSGNPFPAKKKQPSKKAAAKAAQPAAEKKATPAAEPAVEPKTEPPASTDTADATKSADTVDATDANKSAEADKSTTADESTEAKS